jgi:hypothetical protein
MLLKSLSNLPTCAVQHSLEVVRVRSTRPGQSARGPACLAVPAPSKHSERGTCPDPGRASYSFHTVARWRKEGLLTIATSRHPLAAGPEMGTQGRPVSELPAPVNAQDARRVWDSQRCPSSRSVARVLTQAGRPVHFTTIARWRRQGWRSQSTSEHPLTAAVRTLDLAVPLLTGDPTSKVADILGTIEDKDDESRTNRKHMPRVIREAFIASYVLTRLLCEYCPELIPHKPAQIAVLLKALSRLMKAAADTHSQWLNLQLAGHVEP